MSFRMVVLYGFCWARHKQLLKTGHSTCRSCWTKSPFDVRNKSTIPSSVRRGKDSAVWKNFWVLRLGHLKSAIWLQRYPMAYGPMVNPILHPGLMIKSPCNCSTLTTRTLPSGTCSWHQNLSQHWTPAKLQDSLTSLTLRTVPLLWNRYDIYISNNICKN